MAGEFSFSIALSLAVLGVLLCVLLAMRRRSTQDERE